VSHHAASKRPTKRKNTAPRSKKHKNRSSSLPGSSKYNDEFSILDEYPAENPNATISSNSTPSPIIIRKKQKEFSLPILDSIMCNDDDLNTTTAISTNSVSRNNNSYNNNNANSSSSSSNNNNISNNNNNNDDDNNLSCSPQSLTPPYNSSSKSLPTPISVSKKSNLNKRQVVVEAEKSSEALNKSSGGGGGDRRLSLSQFETVANPASESTDLEERDEKEVVGEFVGELAKLEVKLTEPTQAVRKPTTTTLNSNHSTTPVFAADQFISLMFQDFSLIHQLNGSQLYDLAPLLCSLVSATSRGNPSKVEVFGHLFLFLFLFWNELVLVLVRF
jgi:hypothetical protein